MRFGRDAIRLLTGVSDSNGHDALSRPKLDQGGVVYASAVAQPVAPPVKSGEGRENNVGIARRPVGRGFGKAEGALHQFVARREIPEDEGVTHLVHHRQRHPAATRREGLDQRAGVEFAADRPIDRDDRRGDSVLIRDRLDERQSALRDDRRGPMRLLGRHEVAARERMPAQIGFDVGHGGGVPVKRCD